MSTRFDAWTEEHDRLLAETVIRHVRQGSTRLNAFDEAAEAMNRTAAACGYRWSAVLRPEYDKKMEDAKRYRRQMQHRNMSLDIDLDLVKDLALHASRTGRTTKEVAEDAIKTYLQGAGEK